MIRGLRTLLLATALAGAATGCAISERDASQIDGEDVPFGLLDPNAPSIAPSQVGDLAELCLVAGDALVPTIRRLEEDPGQLALVRSLATVTDREAARGLQTAVASAADIQGVTVLDGIATVDLAEDVRASSTSDPLVTVGQIVCTLTGQPGIGRVSFTLAGEPIEVPIADGTLTADPVSRDAYRPLVR